MPTIKVNHYIEKVVKQFPYFINKVIRDGYGVAVVKATPENIIALRNYQKGIENEGVKGIPISGILKHRMLKN